ncbi:hypothetical protein JXJ21_20345 [candidate division KSB1 bacterium]|nr:hypothetical protein [candidate division KSB1 bacterium]
MALHGAWFDENDAGFRLSGVRVNSMRKFRVFVNSSNAAADSNNWFIAPIGK